MDTQIFYTYIFRITEINYVINVYYFLNLLYRIFRTFLLSLLNSFNESGLIIYQKYSIYSVCIVIHVFTIYVAGERKQEERKKNKTFTRFILSENYMTLRENIWKFCKN